MVDEIDQNLIRKFLLKLPDNFINIGYLKNASFSIKKNPSQLTLRKFYFVLHKLLKTFNNQTCDLNWKKSAMDSRRLFYWDKVASDYFRCCVHGEQNDCILTTEGVYVEAHKLVLAMASPFFYSMFRSNIKNVGAFILPGITFVELCEILHYIYTGDVSVHPSQVGRFIDILVMLGIPLPKHNMDDTNSDVEMEYSTHEPMDYCDEDFSLSINRQQLVSESFMDVDYAEENRLTPKIKSAKNNSKHKSKTKSKSKSTKKSHRTRNSPKARRALIF